MKIDTRKILSVRQQILNLLSPEETAKIAMAEGRTPAEGDEFVDLAHPENGVQRVKKDGQFSWNNVVLRSALKDQTWNAIVAKIASV